MTAKLTLYSSARTRRKKAAALAALALMVSAACGGESVYYVSPDGSDAGDGTVGAPFETVGMARDAVRAVTGTMTNDIVINLRGGWYVLDEPLTFDSRDSGRNGFNVIYQAYPGEYPVISGGRQIAGWTLHDAGRNIWKADAPGLETRQLYVDCVRAVRARSESGIPGAVKTATGFTTTDATLATWGNPSDIELVFNSLETRMGESYARYWREWRLGVAGISGTDITMKTAGALDGWCSFVHDEVTVPTYFENAYELLNQPGEWYLNRTQGVVYYKPLVGQDMTRVRAIAPVLETLVSGAGTMESPIGNIQFKGITFAHAGWLAPNGNEGFVSDQSNCRFDGRFPGGNVVFTNAAAIRFERCIFTHLGREGLELSGGSKNCAVVGCVFTDISGTGVRVGTVTDPERLDARLRDTSNEVVNCYIHDIGCEYHDGCGILGGYVSDLLLSHNEIAYTPYSGISCGWGGWGAGIPSCVANNRFTYNYIHHFVQELGDGGGIYTLNGQPGTSWNNNWFDSMPYRTHGGAIYPDESSANMEIYRNVCSDIGYKWLQIWTPTIHAISVHDNWTTTDSKQQNGTDITYYNNTLIPVGFDDWPAEAQAVATNAGLESAYVDIKTRPCACSIAEEAGSTVETPTFDPAEGAYAAAQTVTIGTATRGATIRYTSDGSTPGTSTGALYVGPVNLTASCTLKAIACKTGLTNSAVASGDYTISASELLANAGYEAGLTGWTANGGSLARTTTEQYGGAASCRSYGRTQNWNGPSQNIKSILTSHGRGAYAVSAYLKLAAGSDFGRIQIGLTDGNGTWYPTVIGSISAGGWTQVSGTLDLAWTGTLSAAAFYVNTATSLQELYVDDCSFQKAGTTTTTTTEVPTTTTTTTTQVPTTTTLSPGSLVNGSFEFGTNGWTVLSRDANPAACEVRADEGKTDGMHALAFGVAQARGNAVIAQTLSTVPGVAFAVRFDYGGFGAAGKQQQLLVEALAGATVLTSRVVTAYGSGSFDPVAVTFQERTLQFIAASSATTIRFADQTPLAGSADCDGVLDAVSVESDGAGVSGSVFIVK